MLPNRRNFAKSGHTESYANTSTYTLVHIGYTYISHLSQFPHKNEML